MVYSKHYVTHNVILVSFVLHNVFYHRSSDNMGQQRLFHLSLEMSDKLCFTGLINIVHLQHNSV